MLTVLAEQPIMVTILLVIPAVALFYVWLQNGDRRFLGTAGLLAILAPLAFLTAEWIETDREKIRAIIFATADAVQQNDHDTAVQVIQDDSTRQRALAELPNYEFHRIGVRNVRIRMVEGSSPLEANVDLDASVMASQTRGTLKNIRVPRRIILTFEKQMDDSWKVTDYTHQPLAGGPDAFSPRP